MVAERFVSWWSKAKKFYGDFKSDYIDMSNDK